MPQQILKRKKFLIITTSGGGAHLTTAEALRDRLEAGDLSVSKPELIITTDVLKELVGPIGKMGIWLWNSAMRQGRTRRLQKLLALQRAADLLFVPIFFWVLYFLCHYKIDAIYDCQPLGTRYTLLASRIVSVFQKRHILVMKVLTEPSNALLKQYFLPIRNISPFLRNHLRLWASEPLCQPGQSNEEFWSINCKLDPLQIFFETGFPIRTPFLKWAGKKPDSILNLPLYIYNQEEAAWFSQNFDLPIDIQNNNNSEQKCLMEIPEQSQLITIMLGSQGTADATLEYTRLILQNWSDPLLYIFVYTGNFQHGGKQISQKILAYRNQYRSQTKIVPMSFQPAAMLAKLFTRTTISITRSGGATCMELLTIAQGYPLIHSGKDKNFKHNEGLVEHEYGNYLYLKNYHPHSARLIDSNNLIPVIQEIFNKTRSRY